MEQEVAVRRASIGEVEHATFTVLTFYSGAKSKGAKMLYIREKSLCDWNFTPSLN